MNGEGPAFLFTSACVVGAGLLIGRVSGVAGERLGLGRAWAGAVLLSFATTLPELVTTITVARHGAYGMAAGNILGSVLFNLFILVLVDLADPEPFYHRLSFNHLATGLLVAVLLGVTIAGLSLGVARGQGLGEFGGFPGATTAVVLLGAYIGGQYVLFRLARTSAGGEMKTATRFDRWPSPALGLLYLALAVVIFFAARRMAISAERLADHYRLGATFAGVTLLGVITSLPEISNGIACARRRDFDLAMGNVLGANALVLAVLGVADLTAGACLFIRMPFPEAVSSLTLAALGVVMTGVAMGSLALRSTHKIFRVSATSLLLAALFGVSLMVSYRFSP